MTITVKALRALAPGGRVGDGNGMFARRSHKGEGISFFLRIQVNGRRVERGLGGWDGTTWGIGEARDKARRLREEAFGVGEVPVSRAETVSRAQEARKRAAVSFSDVADRLIEARTPSWRNPKSPNQWRASLETYAYPTIGHLAPADVTTEHALAILEPIWSTKPETASRVRSRCEAVMGSARVRGLDVDRVNPFQWRGHLALILPPLGRVQKVQHHAAMPFADVPAFWAELQGRDGMAARALEFVILTAARSGEVRGAKWREIDLDARLWTIPADRMKAGREHVVPLSDAVLAVLDKVVGAIPHPDELVFPGWRAGVLSDMSMGAVLKRMDRAVTTHGFRASFRSFAAATGADDATAEGCLAHVEGSRVVRAYQRHDRLEARRALLERWAAHVVGQNRLSP